MKFTIGTASSSLGFEEDIKLIKSSLLYADEIELIGMAEYAIFKYLPRCINSSKDIDSFADAFIPLLNSLKLEGSDELVYELQRVKAQIAPFSKMLSQKKHRSKQVILAQMQTDKVMKEVQKSINLSLDEFVASPNALEIKKLISKDIIRVFDYESKGFDLDELAGGYLGNLVRTMQNNTSYPLFDKTSNDTISAFSKTCILDIGNVKQEVLAHAGIATNILMTLPTLQSASVDEILDFKKDMEGPLISFRKSIYEFSEKVQSRPWDDDFQYDCLKIYSTEVLPRVEELNELTSETSVLKNMGSRVLADEDFRKSVKWVTGGLATTITSSSNIMGAMDNLVKLITTASILVIAPNAVSAFLKTLNAMNETKKETNQIVKQMKANSMYYYYKAMHNLGK